MKLLASILTAWASVQVGMTMTVAFQPQPQPIRKRSSSSSSSSSQLHLKTYDASAVSGCKQVTVIGGTGFVGSKVCELLVAQGVDVTSVSKSGSYKSSVNDSSDDESWTSKVTWNAADLLTADESTIDAAIGSPNAIISCLGVIGNDSTILKQGNGDANCAAFASAAKSSKLSRAIYVSVSSEVVACQDSWLPEFFKGYFDGKAMAEACALDAVDGDSTKVCLVKPSFIYGGDKFGLIPPRVTSDYGSFIEELLSLGVFNFLADITPGLIKVALRAPSSVEAVAGACVDAALGDSDSSGKTLEGCVEINEASGQPPATGLTDAVEWVKEKTGEVVEFTKEEVIPKVLAKVEEIQKASKK
eukprot:CAMPEP_0194075824 /NCGR_PEP_ID=MMETSP0149-20130528/2749_1 /TAXON_ID=122233 /ORGANISM="Chaetoceros debilis, Strain MM31A-1" /LENGTH=358 /DNA_ID=CAMNT_0038756409 /DNA_START=68 /DNA_END=1144 /DNA_ORIENTATION=-